jgi:hypothetical protein
MFKLTSTILKCLSQEKKNTLDVCYNSIRELKTRGEYFRKFGYKYTELYKGGK